MRRPGLPGLILTVVAGLPAAAGAQQGSVQASASVQAVTGDASRLAGQHRLEPDVGVTWLQPGSRVGLFQLEARAGRRNDRLHAGRLFASIRELKLGGITWAVEAGDTHFTPAIGEYRFTNLFTPAVAFSGAAVSARTSTTTVAFTAGRTTAWRNIFGTDPQTLNQTLGTLRVTHRRSDRLHVSARASRVRTSDLAEFGYSIAASDQAGGGMRLWVTPELQASGDASFVSYVRKGTGLRERDGSVMAGVSWLHARGWLQVNGSRFSPGDFPALNTPLPDREGLFTAGEYDLVPRLRLFAGWEAFRSNLRPASAVLQPEPAPQASGTRAFGGGRLRLTDRSTLTVRGEHGGRVSRPLRTGIGSDSDTGFWTAEWQASAGPFTSFTRYARRENVERVHGVGSYNQHDASVQLFSTLKRRTQLFASAVATRNELPDGGSTYWQFGGGGQFQTPRRDLYVRGEFTLSRNIDLLSRAFVPRESLGVGLNGQLTRNTSVAVNVQVDRAPLGPGGGNPWLTRSILRVNRMLPTGSAYMSSGVATTEATPGRGGGAITGTVYADWNGNGVFDAGDQLLEGIPVRVGAAQLATTGRDGQFAFLNVPTGTSAVGLDTGSLPIDFDPPEIARIELQVARGTSQRVSFPLVPLGAITGRVLRDANGNGRADAADEPIPGAVVVLDGGARSEQTRNGAFRFDAVRHGHHRVKLLTESLPHGAVVTGAIEVAAALGREAMTAEVGFLVSVERRPEIRRVFPPPAPPQRGRPRPAAPATEPARRDTPAAARPPEKAKAATASRRYAVQVAALHDPDATVELLKALQAEGLAAYVSHPGPADPAPYRIRVGPFTSRAAADRAVADIEQRRGQKVWVVRER